MDVRRKAFTLVELLVVIAIIGILIGMLLPAVQSVREAARRSACMNQMRQFSLALHNYESALQHFPPSRLLPDDNIIPSDIAASSSQETAFQSWTTLILPFIEQSNLGDNFDFRQAWFDNVESQNYEVIQTQVDLFKCPSSPTQDGVDPFHVIGAAAGDYGTINEVKSKVYTDVLGRDAPSESSRLGVLSKLQKNKIQSITDGTSNTFMLAECAGQPQVWVNGHRMSDDEYDTYLDNNEDIVTRHQGQLVPTEGVGWADPDCGFSINGATSDGLDKHGPVMINAINVSEVYGFHTGGATFAMADGSTHFVSETVDTQTFVDRCTRSGGEIVDDF